MYKKKGYPEVGDLVLCTVSKTLPHSAFAILDEYEKLEGMIHASEISRKWARNLKSFLKEGTKLVCKVMDINKDKGHINLSVRRVGASQERSKKEEWKNEKKANDLLELFSKQSKTSVEEIYEKIGNPILDKYGLLYPLFQDVAKYGAEAISDLKTDKKLSKGFVELIESRITLPRAHVSGVLKISSNASDGIEKIKEAIKSTLALAKKKKIDLSISYIGTPKYKFDAYAEDPKELDASIADILEALKAYIEKNEGMLEVARSK